jgi:4-aminobutyrate aminotransferase-like enzyme
MLHGHTHSCYPLACVAALKNIEIIERDHLVENSRIVGQYLHEQLKKLKEEFPEIGDVRGRGLLQGFEIEDSPTGIDKWIFGQRLYETMLANGLVTELESRKNLSNVVIVLHPALIVTEKDVNQAVAIVKDSLMACRQ